MILVSKKTSTGRLDKIEMRLRPDLDSAVRYVMSMSGSEPFDLFYFNAYKVFEDKPPECLNRIIREIIKRDEKFMEKVYIKY